jgi:hypothetical protein
MKVVSVLSLTSVILFLAVADVPVEARRRKKRASAEASTFVEDDDLNVESTYEVSDPAADHAGVGMQRAGDDDLDGALEAFRAQLKFDQHKANAHNNLGVTLLRMGNSRDAETARRLYYQALTNFQSSLQQGNGGAQDNIDAIHQNCKIRYNTNCGEAFAAFTGGVGVFSSGDDEEDVSGSNLSLVFFIFILLCGLTHFICPSLPPTRIHSIHRTGKIPTKMTGARTGMTGKTKVRAPAVMMEIGKTTKEAMM